MYSLKFLLALLLICCASCSSNEEAELKKNNIPFDKTKWLIKEKRQYPYREKMLTDLIQNHQIKGLTKPEVFNLLGEPSRTDSNYLFYTVNQQLLGDLLPLHTKTLVIKFINDTVEWRRIHQ